ncbi:MAG: putative peptidoglycan glycosyltransferase FtsW [bacterium]
MRSFSGDRTFLGIVTILALGGIAIFSSAALGLLARTGSAVSHEILSQAVLGLGGGIVAFIIARRVPLSFVRKAAPYAFLASLALTLLVFVPGLGTHANGATRWIDVGFTTIQPAEFLKIGVVLMMAWYLAKYARQLHDFTKGLLPFIVIVGIPALVLLMQPNTSTTLLIGSTAAVMYFAAGAPWRDFGVLLVLALVAGGAILFLRPYALERVMTFINPSENSLDSSYQIQQSLIAVGSGGLAGRGFGESVQKFNYLPEPDGDSVFAVFAEECGFIGAVLLVLLFAALAARGIVIAGESRDMFGGLIALGLSWLIAFQAFVNMSAMLGIIPLTGLPLPFVSHGGTALLVVLACAGLILNIAAHRKQTT